MKLLNIDSEVDNLFTYIALIRRYKTEHSIKYSQDSEELIVCWHEQLITELSNYSNELKSISRSKKVTFVLWENSSINIRL